MKNKICVYAICKDEMKYIDAWLESMSEADYIVVLDTGSTDGTYEKLQEDDRVFKVKQKIYPKFRFDVARNDSMKLCPKDANILICTDFDETFDKGWSNYIRNNWTDETQRAHYKYSWTETHTGEPAYIFMYDKCHNRNYNWIYPAHEVLMAKGFDETNVLQCDDTVFLHHHQDLTKDRNFYTDLIKIGIEENPEDVHYQYIYARELGLKKDYHNSLVEFLKILGMTYVNDKKYRLVKLSTLQHIAELYAMYNNYAEAVKYYFMFLQEDPTYREPYFCLAEIFNMIGQYHIAEDMVKDGFNRSIRKYDWVENADSWIAKGNDILSVSCFYQGKYDEAIQNIETALYYAPDNLRLLKNCIAYYKAKCESDK